MGGGELTRNGCTICVMASINQLNFDIHCMGFGDFASKWAILYCLYWWLYRCI